MVGSNLSLESLSILELWTRIYSNQKTKHYNREGVRCVVDLLEQTNCGWRDAVRENAQLLELNARRTQQIKKYEQALEEMKEANRQLESNLAVDEAKIFSVKTELAEYQRRFKAAKVELQQHTFGVNRDEHNSFTFVDEINHDQNSIRIGVKRHSNLEEVFPGKRLKKGTQQQNGEEGLGSVSVRAIVPSAPEEDERELVPPLRIIPQPRSTQIVRRRSKSVDADRSMAPPPVPPHYCTPASKRKRLPGAKMDGFGNGWARGRAIHSCRHAFEEDRALVKMLQSCKLCNRPLGISYSRCRDCKLCLHADCRSRAPLPCVPFVQPLSAAKPGQRHRLEDFCPDSFPKVPAQLVRCVCALEMDRQNGVEVYEGGMGVPGADPSVIELKECFRKMQSATHLDGVPAHTMAAFVKDFLQELQEPLISANSYEEFLHAAKRGDLRLLKRAIDDLQSSPNRDALAYLCAHWQRLAERWSKANNGSGNDPIKAIARAVAPSVCSEKPKIEEQWLCTAAQEGVEPPLEVAKHITIVEQLLRLEKDYWTGLCRSTSMVSVDQQSAMATPVQSAKSNPQMRQTPKSSRATQPEPRVSDRMHFDADHSLLGPVIGTNSQLVRRMPVRKQPLFEKPY